jgi:hypothetical protein
MSKPLGYWGASYDNPLIRDIAQHYNELQDIDERDQSWLLGRLGSHYWMRWCQVPPSEAAQEVRDRLEELPKYQLACLVQAIGDKSSTKPLGYYSCDYNIPLIMDIHNHFGDNLENMNEVDQVWLLGMMGDFYYEHHCEGDISESEAADEVRDRLHQLDRTNCGALLQALSNR